MRRHRRGIGGVAAGEEVEPAVVVVVEEPGGEGVAFAAETGLIGYSVKIHSPVSRMSRVAGAVVAEEIAGTEHGGE